MLSWFLLLSAQAAEPEVGVVVEPLIAVDIAADRDAEDTLESWTWVRAHARGDSGNGRWFLGVDAEHHLRHGVDTEGMWEARVGESGWAGPVGPTHTRVGMLVERWGKLDLLRVVDVLNPVDMRAGPLATVEALRVPVPMMTTQLGKDSLRAELILIPFASADRASLVGGDWSIVRPGMLENLLADVQTWEGGSAAFLSEPIAALETSLGDAEPSTMRALGDALGGSGRPEALGVNGEAAIRLEWEAPGLDLALMGASLRSHVPATSLAPAWRDLLTDQALPALDQVTALTESEPISVSWPRTWMGGFEAATVAGPIGVRTEAAWWSDKVAQTAYLGSEVSPAVAAGIGLDWMHGTTLFTSIETRWHRWLEPPDDLLFTREDVVEVGGTIRLALAQERLEIQGAGLYAWPVEDVLVRPDIRWRVSDPLAIGLGAVILGGPKDPPTSLMDALTWDGGQLGYFGDNDCVFATLRWIQ